MSDGTQDAGRGVAMITRTRGASRLGRTGIAAAFVCALCACAGIGAPAASADNLPAVTTNPAEEVGVTTAKLSAEVNPNGEAGSGNTTWRIQYSPAGEGAWNTANEGTIEAPASEAANPVAVEAIFGFGGELQPGAEYEFRIQAENGAGAEETATPYPTFEMQEVTTPVLATNLATEVAYSTAHLSGTVNPEGGNVNPIGPEVFSIYYQLQYSHDPEGEGWATAKEGFIEGAEAQSSSPIEVGEDLAPGTLHPGTEYKTRLFAYYMNFSREAGSPEPFESFATGAVAKPTVSLEAPSSVNPATGHYYFSGHVNPNAPKSEAEEPSAAEEEAFTTRWRFECEPGCSSPSGEDVKAGSESRLVQADVENLQANTHYTLTLHAENLGGESVSEVRSFKTSAAVPGVATGTNTPDPEGDGVTVRGYVNPRNTEVTKCEFRYGLTTSYGQTVPCEGEPGSGGEPVEVTMDPSGLQAGATYHFQVIATNAAGTNQSEDSTFATSSPEPAAGCPNEARRAEQHSTYLPDCRAYEMVSPPEKNGGDIVADSRRTRAAAEETPGSPMAATFVSLSGFGDVAGTGIAAEYMGIRTAQPGTQGWATHAITPQQDPGTFITGLNAADPLWEGELSADLTSGVFRAWSPLTSEDPNVANTENLYVRHDLRSSGPGAYQLASPCPLCGSPLPPFSSSSQIPRLAGASDDFSHVLFESRYVLAEGAGAGGANLYESVNGNLRFVGLVPASGNECTGSECVPAERAIAGQGAGSGGIVPRYTLHTISADGSRIFFTAEPDCPGDPTCGTLYMREDGTKTVKINVSEKTVPDPAQAATFWTASTDGSRAFFTSAEQLTDDDHDNAPDLYMWEADAPAGERLTRISVDHEPADVANGVDGTIGASEDGHYVYFVASGQLVAGNPVLQGTRAFYEWHDGTTSYIGEMAGPAADLPTDLPDTWNLNPLGARVSSDGQHLLFTSHSGVGLTGYDQSHCSGSGCLELYTYSANTHTLQCASCNPSGEPAIFNAGITVSTGAGSTDTSWHLNRATSADGRHAFFTTAEALVPEDTNGVNDAYEYDTETATPHLLSSGTDAAESFFLEASADGHDAFFLTRQQFLGWDTDHSYDLYDARTGGGLPEPAAIAAPCVGESCRPAVPSTPPAASPASSSFAGAGNPKAQRKSKKHKHPRRRHHRRANANGRAGR